MNIYKPDDINYCSRYVRVLFNYRTLYFMQNDECFVHSVLNNGLLNSRNTQDHKRLDSILRKILNPPLDKPD